MIGGAAIFIPRLSSFKRSKLLSFESIKAFLSMRDLPIISYTTFMVTRTAESSGELDGTLHMTSTSQTSRLFGDVRPSVSVHFHPFLCFIFLIFFTCFSLPPSNDFTSLNSLVKGFGTTAEPVLAEELRQGRGVPAVLTAVLPEVSFPWLHGRSCRGRRSATSLAKPCCCLKQRCNTRQKGKEQMNQVNMNEPCIE